MDDERASVQAGLDHLAARLNPYIATVLKPILNDLPWTTILTELDRAKGYTPKHYTATDLQAQLRILTERLGEIGYPFSDPTRAVSVLGGELRIVRNRWAHHDEFTALDAWRTHDFVVRLLSHVGDREGTATAEDMRSSALQRVIQESGLATSRASNPESSSVSQRSDASVVPRESVLKRSEPAETPTIGAQRIGFQPWTVVHAGDVSVLDELPKKRAREQIAAVITDIVDAEGPIHIDRLARLTAQSFGVERLHPTRAKKVKGQIKASGCQIDRDNFVWPTNIVYSTWTEFRPNPGTVDRPFEEISPVEIANAARFLIETGTTTASDVESEVLQTFGRSRRTKSVKKHLEKALSRVKYRIE